MKNLLNVLFILLFISSCSDTDNSTFPEINDEEENDTEKIILEIEDTRKNIFDYAVFGLFPNDYFIMFSLFDIYDSITWKVSNLDGSLKIFNIQKVAPIHTSMVSFFL